MQTVIPYSSSLQETFRILGQKSNLACVEVLGQALCSPITQVRSNALQTLIQRGGDADIATILERIDECQEAELPLLRTHVPLLLAAIEAGLADREPIKRQRALCAIAKLRIAPLFYHLILAAQSTDDPQQIVASELTIGIATAFGTEARYRLSKNNEANREQLLADLWQSILLFNDHRILQIVDAWLCASNWDDAAFKDLFQSTRSEPIHKVVIRQLTQSNRTQVVELLAGVLWSRGAGPKAVKIMSERNDPSMAMRLADLTSKFGITPFVSKNLGMNIPIPCLEQFNFADEAFPLEHRCALIQLLSVADTTPDKVIHGVTQLLDSKDPSVAPACASAIRNLKSLKTDVVVMVLSDCFENIGMESYVPPPWKTSLRKALDRLLEIYPSQATAVRTSIEFALSDFRCEELIKHLDDWPESHLKAYARIVRVAEAGFKEVIERYARSQSAVKRSLAIHAARFLGMEHGLSDMVLKAIEDESEKVRAAAIHTIVAGLNRDEAIELLKPLLQDENASVKADAIFALSRLESSLHHDS
ncbi:MAG: HEAT repeat domain-containing protein [Planctomycetota bacterium]|nr:HEAT repeat domain-containing protein [Planctomycetota bacterium]